MIICRLFYSTLEFTSESKNLHRSMKKKSPIFMYHITRSNTSLAIQLLHRSSWFLFILPKGMIIDFFHYNVYINIKKLRSENDAAEMKIIWVQCINHAGEKHLKICCMQLDLLYQYPYRWRVKWTLTIWFLYFDWRKLIYLRYLLQYVAYEINLYFAISSFF